MLARFVRGTVRSAAFAAAVTSTLTWAPTATAEPSEPTPSASTSSAETPAAETGSIAITQKDAAGDILSGAAFLLLDSTGKEAGRGTTDAQGNLTFPDLAPGVYRLKETASGSPLHEAVADQDVIVTPGATTRLAITDPFKAAKVLFQAKDDKTGKLLPGSTVNIGTGESTLLTLTTGLQGTATGELPVTSRKTQFWVKQVTAPHGYDLYKPAKAFTAGPGAPVTVTVTNARTATAPKPDPTDKPTGSAPTPRESPSERRSGGSNPPATGTSATGSDTTTAADPADDATPTMPAGSLAHTGADATPWIAGGASCLVAIGIATLVAARRRASAKPQPDNESETS